MKIISDKRDLRVRQFLRTGANVNFQIAVALACLLDIRISFIYTPVHAYAWAQSCSWIKFSFECAKVLIQC